MIARGLIVFLMATSISIPYIPKVFDFFEANPDKSIYIIAGGRGKGATWGIGYELITRSLETEHFILCTREIKDTVDHSSRRTIEQLISRAGLAPYFDFQKTQTICRTTGSRFIYTGLSKVTEDNVQGMEGISMVWLGEAHTMEMSSWQKLEPTVRADGSRIYVDYNIRYANTPIHKMFTRDPQGWPFEGNPEIKDLAYLFMDYRDNPFISKKLLEVSERNKKQYTPEDWAWIWLGKLKDASDHYICDGALVSAAMSRNSEAPAYGMFHVGADIAHMGGDEIVFYRRRGDVVIGQKILSKLSTPDVYRELIAFGGNNEKMKGETIYNVDNGHVGAAVCDMLEEGGFKVNRINFGAKDMMYFDPDHCADNMTDMAFNLVERLKTASIPHDDILYNQITQRRWDFLNEKGIRRIESKDDFKKHAMGMEGHTSPDRYDALKLCFYEPQNTVGVMAMPHNII